MKSNINKVKYKICCYLPSGLRTRCRPSPSPEEVLEAASVGAAASASDCQKAARGRKKMESKKRGK